MAIKCRGDHVLGGLFTGIDTRHIVMTSKMVHILNFILNSVETKVYFSYLAIFLFFKVYSHFLRLRSTLVCKRSPIRLL